MRLITFLRNRLKITLITIAVFLIWGWLTEPLDKGKFYWKGEHRDFLKSIATFKKEIERQDSCKIGWSKSNITPKWYAFLR